MNNVSRFLSFFFVLFVVSSNVFAASQVLLGPLEFQRTTTTPLELTYRFNGSVGVGQLTLYNGDEDGLNRISSGVISVNGLQVFTPQDFSSHQYENALVLNLLEDNTLTIRLTSKSGCYLSLVVTQEQDEYSLPTLTVNASPLEVLAGQSSTLNWLAEDAETCSIEPDIGAVPLTGSLVMSPDSTTTYTVTALNQTGSIFETVTIDVIQPVPIVNLSVSPDLIMVGEMATLAWSSANADSCSISPDIGPVATEGSLEVSPLISTDYIITATGVGGSATAMAVVSVTDPEPIAVLNADPISIVPGESSRLTWSSQYAHTCTLAPDIGMIPCSGDLVVVPVQDTTYILTATGDGGSVAVQSAITVTPSGPLSLIIETPFDGATILRSDVQVRGTVVHIEGLEVGVTVNGVAALLEDTLFVANHVFLQEGENQISVTAVDINGESLTKSVTLTAEPASRLVTLLTDTESGLAPMDITLSLLSNFTITGVPGLDDSGPAPLTITPVTDAENWTVNISEPGIYHFTVQVEDDTGAVYTDSVSVQAMDRDVLDGKLQEKWRWMKAAVIAGDLETSLSYFISSSQDKYRNIFTGLWEQLPAIYSEMQDIELISYRDGYAKYHIKRIHTVDGSDVEITYYIYFRPDLDGQFKIYKY